MIYYIDKKDKQVTLDNVGGKGYSLIEMHMNNIPVPGGIIISTDVYKDFINDDIISKNLKIIKKEGNEARVALDSIIARIKQIKFDKEFVAELEEKIGEYDNTFFSVRSSANVEDSGTMSFAGEFESFLFVKKDNILEAIMGCYISVFTERILSYLDAPSDIVHINMAVVIQVMIDSDTSGVCFTASPLDDEEDDILIEAVHGLGEYLVQGSITPDKYIIQRETHIPIEVEFQEQPKMIKSKKYGGIKLVRNDNKTVQKLNGDQMVYLAKMAEKIEGINNNPRDIEWAYMNGDLYILQSRPIVFTD